jgi:hypothetical protein
MNSLRSENLSHVLSLFLIPDENPDPSLGLGGRKTFGFVDFPELPFLCFRGYNVPFSYRSSGPVLQDLFCLILT